MKFTLRFLLHLILWLSVLTLIAAVLRYVIVKWLAASFLPEGGEWVGMGEYMVQVAGLAKSLLPPALFGAAWTVFPAPKRGWLPAMMTGAVMFLFAGYLWPALSLEMYVSLYRSKIESEKFRLVENTMMKVEDGSLYVKKYDESKKMAYKVSYREDLTASTITLADSAGISVDEESRNIHILMYHGEVMRGMNRYRTNPDSVPFQKIEFDTLSLNLRLPGYLNTQTSREENRATLGRSFVVRSFGGLFADLDSLALEKDSFILSIRGHSFLYKQQSSSSSSTGYSSDWGQTSPPPSEEEILNRAMSNSRAEKNWYRHSRSRVENIEERSERTLKEMWKRILFPIACIFAFIAGWLPNRRGYQPTLPAIFGLTAGITLVIAIASAAVTWKLDKHHFANTGILDLALWALAALIFWTALRKKNRRNTAA